MHRQQKEMAAYASVVAIVLIVMLLQFGVGYFVTALALVMLTSMCWIFLFSNHLQDIRKALEEADAELDVYDSLRMLVDDIIYFGRGIKALELWVDENPPSDAHEQVKKASQS